MRHESTRSLDAALARPLVCAVVPARSSPYAGAASNLVSFVRRRNRQVAALAASAVGHRRPHRARSPRRLQHRRDGPRPQVLQRASRYLLPVGLGRPPRPPARRGNYLSPDPSLPVVTMAPQTSQRRHIGSRAALCNLRNLHNIAPVAADAAGPSPLATVGPHQLFCRPTGGETASDLGKRPHVRAKIPLRPFLNGVTAGQGPNRSPSPSTPAARPRRPLAAVRPTDGLRNLCNCYL